MSRRIDVPGDGHIELPDTRDGYASAVIRRGPEGAVAWQVLPPDRDGDAWVDVSLKGDIVAANSWSGWLVEFDVATGTETARHFTK
ncbi:MAG TPA: hypothetical protein VMT27_04090 [Actinomycetes bacterium]|nr:hypothetical protein [Actinomycetes bacterium]